MIPTSKAEGLGHITYFFSLDSYHLQKCNIADNTGLAFFNVY